MPRNGSIATPITRLATNPAAAQATPSPSISSVNLLAMVGSPQGWYR